MYLEIDASGISLAARMLQVSEGMNCGHNEVPDNITLCPIAFASKVLSNAELQYSNIKWEALGTLHGIEKLHHYCLVRKYM